jgi:mycothiol synthase
VLTVRVTPDDVNEALAASEAVRGLTGGDDLDLSLVGRAHLGALVAEARAAGATAIELQVTDASDVHQAIAEANGLALRREVLKLGRDLPVGEPWRLDTRPFEVGRDEDAWLAVNNRAFAWHPDQGGWTREQLTAREAEAWFDPAGFLLHEREGRLVAFCWTKVHPGDRRLRRPPVGEIFVIGVDPDAAGHGIGRAIVLAGLDHLAGLGLRQAILYVESTNARARALYEHLGFTHLATDRWWHLDLAAEPAPAPQ